MIQPIKDVFTNWRNPQHRQIETVVYNFSPNTKKSVRIDVITNTRYTIFDKLETYPTHENPRVGRYPLVDVTIWGTGLIKEWFKVEIPNNGITTYVAWKINGEDWHVLKDER